MRNCWKWEVFEVRSRNAECGMRNYWKWEVFEVGSRNAEVGKREQNIEKGSRDSD